MKRVLSLGLIFLSFFLLQCEDDALENPHYPAEPSISFKSIKFIETPAVNENDTLKLTIKYKDGDSDLGLSGDDIEFPYQEAYYFLANGLGDTTKAFSSIKICKDCSYPWSSYEYRTIAFITPPNGKLVTTKTRLKPEYNYLPEYDPNSCLNYFYFQLLVPEESNIIDNSFNILDTLVDGNNKKFIEIEEAILYQRNENYYNIFVEFYASDDGVNFTEFNWYEEFCIDFNGRFPYVGKHVGTFYFYMTIGYGWAPFKVKAETPWNGEISYKMTNSSFLALFSNKTLKLRITIKDRALHTSNVIETPPFTLESIK